MTQNRSVCVHGHFYQPPRENPWLETIEIQDSAYPYHDWNERVNAECYRPNSAARILGADGLIERIVNNYSRMSFNFGPTLLSWLEHAASDVYQALLHADQLSQKRFSGHGSAIAQGYSHLIFPLANARDKKTQVIWGRRDFVRRFGREPEGMWLPETAVDTATLEALAEQGIRFTILAPHQVSAVRPLGATEWQTVSSETLDTTIPYRVDLPSGRSIVIFPYNGPVAHDLAFGTLLDNGEQFLARLQTEFSQNAAHPQLVHIATDGETYGHHHRFGDMALAYVLDRLDRDAATSLTNYGEVLDRFGITHAARIHENTSWSCVHGIERWRSNCGCNTGANPGWNQMWRSPLRSAMDRLRDRVAPLYEERARRLVRDPWNARDAYIDVVLDRSPASIRHYLDAQALHPLSSEEQVTAFRLLELQRHAMLMYTSCGWFFDDLAGLESIQVLQYAARSLQLAEQLFEEDLESEFLSILGEAHSNRPEEGDGRRVFDLHVRPAAVDLPKAVAHHALTADLPTQDKRNLLRAYTFDPIDRIERRRQDAFLALGRTRVQFVVTGESAVVTYAAVHPGDPDVLVAVRGDVADDAYKSTAAGLTSAFEQGETDRLRTTLDTAFPSRVYSLSLLFREEQRRLLDTMLASTLRRIEDAYRADYERHEPLIRLLADLGIPLPQTLRTLADFVIHDELGAVTNHAVIDVERFEERLRQAEAWKIPIDRAGLAYRLEQWLASATSRWGDRPADADLARRILETVTLARRHSLDVDLWKTQNVFYRIAHTAGSAEFVNDATWRKMSADLAEALSISWPNSSLGDAPQ